MTSCDVTDIPAGSRFVRLLLRDRYDYHQGVIVTELEGGETLHLTGWIGKPPGFRTWLTYRDTLYPKARRAEWERRDPITGEYRKVSLPLPPPR